MQHKHFGKSDWLTEECENIYTRFQSFYNHCSEITKYHTHRKLSHLGIRLLKVHELMDGRNRIM